MIKHRHAIVLHIVPPSVLYTRSSWCIVSVVKHASRSLNDGLTKGWGLVVSSYLIPSFYLLQPNSSIKVLCLQWLFPKQALTGEKGRKILGKENS